MFHKQIASNSRNKALAVVSDRKLPASVSNALKQLLLAYPAGPSVSDEDYAVRVAVFVGTAEEFHPSIAEKAAKRLITMNPRNPFPPTPQDYHDAMCQAYRNLEYKLYSFLTDDLDIIEPPDLPSDVAREMIRDMFTRGYVDYYRARKPIQGFEYMKEATFARWPVDILRELGVYDAIVEMRSTRRAYFTNLGNEELRLKWSEADSKYTEAIARKKRRISGTIAEWAEDFLAEINNVNGSGHRLTTQG
jgi:hypothetical protein